MFCNIFIVNLIFLVIPKSKSQRYIEHDECGQDDYLKVYESMQNFVYKKLSGILQSSIEFIDVQSRVQSPKSLKDDNECSLKLLKGTDPIVIKTDDANQQHVTPSKRKAIEKRKLPNEVEASNDEKIKTSVISQSQIKEETKTWNTKSKPNKLFQYKQTALNEGKRVAHLIEPTGEFTKLRRKNNWDESKVARKQY